MAEGCADLPDECWEIIFSQLDHHSHLEALSLCCKRFTPIISRLRTHFTVVDPTIILHSTLFKFLLRFRHLRSIDLSQFRGDLDRVIWEIANSGLDIEILDVSGNDLSLSYLKRYGSNMKSLRVLKCRGLCPFRDTELFTIGHSLPWLEELDISYPRNAVDSMPFQVQTLSPTEVGVTDTGIEGLSLKLRNLRSINVSGNPFLTDKSLASLFSNCALLKEIRVLHCPMVTQKGILLTIFYAMNLSSIAVDQIQIPQYRDNSFFLDAIGSARYLSALELYDSVVTDDFLRSLAKVCIPLKRFTLAFCSNFTSSGVSYLLCRYRDLEFLDFSGVGFLTDKYMSELSEYLYNLVTIKLKSCSMLTESTFFMLAKTCHLLEDVDMGETNIGGGDGTADIVKNPRIKSLSLACNKNLSDKCLAMLASVCPSLELLDVSFCSDITDLGISEFLKCESKIRQILINECQGVESIGTGSKLPNLEVLRAARSGIKDQGLMAIGNRCLGLLNLDLEGCLGVTTIGLREVVTNCNGLREINLDKCVDLTLSDVHGLVFSRRSLKKIIVPHFLKPTESQKNLYLRHGCLVCTAWPSR